MKDDLFALTKCYLIIIVIGLFCTAANAANLTLITHEGYVSFSVGDKWGVLAFETKKPIQIAVFKVPMAGEKDSDQATNVSISLINPKLPEAEKALSIIGHAYGPKSPIASDYKEWTMFRQNAVSSGITFTIVDAKRKIADVIVAVRFAWPASRDQEADTLLYNLLDSVSGAFGQYRQKDGEIIRRPIN